MLVTAVALPLAPSGCVSPTKPPAPPSGGQQLVLSQAEFDAMVEPVLTAHGCDATGDCHGGGIRGTLELSPPNAKNAQFDFDQVVMQVSISNRDASPILLKPLALAAGGTPHSFKPFATTGDSDWVKIRAWVDAGVIQ